MAETTETLYSYELPYMTGRKPLLTSVKRSEVNKDTIPEILRGIQKRHQLNVIETNMLLNEYLGVQLILERERDFNLDINNKLVVNRAQEIVRKAVGYFLGEPISYTSRSANSAGGASIENLNEYMEEEDKAAKDIELGEWASICGTSFRLVMANPIDLPDEIPFNIPTCDPRATGVVYSSEVLQQPVLGFVFYPIVDAEGAVIGHTYWVYSDSKQFIFTSSGQEALGGDFEYVTESEHFMTDIPIVEYLNNQWRKGDFECAISLLDALNLSLSDRVNAVVQTVGSILVFVDCEPDEDGTTKIKQKGSLCIKTNSATNARIEYVSPQLLQSDAQILEDTINNYIDATTGIPSRSDKGGGGGDTGDAVYLRDGYQDLELVVRNKERAFKRGERKTIRLVAKVMERFGESFNPRDVQINMVRNRNTNILNKSQAAINFVNSKLLDPVDTIKLLGVTDQPTEMAARGQADTEAQTAKLLEQAQKQADMQTQNETADAVTDNGTKTDKVDTSED